MQNMELSVSLMKFLLETQGSFGGFFLFEILHFTMVFRGIGLSKLFPVSVNVSVAVGFLTRNSA